MGKSKTEKSAAFELACVRKEIITYCESLPQIIKTHGVNCLGNVALNVGKCFLTIGGTLDRYTLHQPLPGVAPLPRVQDLGEQLRIAGLDVLHNPTAGDLKRTAEALRRQAELLDEISNSEGKQ